MADKVDAKVLGTTKHTHKVALVSLRQNEDDVMMRRR